MTKLFFVFAILFFLGQETFSCSSRDCGCFKAGSVDNTCDRDLGQCPCKPNFRFEKCDSCNRGYFWFPKCWKGCTLASCNFLLAGFESDERIHPLGHGFHPPQLSASEESYEYFDLFVDENKKYKSMIGGIVGIKCLVWLYGKDGSQKSFEISRFGDVGPRDNAKIDISNTRFAIQTDNDDLVGLTNQFDIYIIKNVNDGWSVLKQFPPGTEKSKEWGDILCATMFDLQKLLVITTGTNSRIMYFNLNSKDWTEGPSLGNLARGVGTCSMMDEANLIFVKSPNIDAVIDTTTGKKVDNYFDKNELPNSISDATILKGAFGHLLFGGSSNKIYYLPKGTKEWRESKQEMSRGLQKTFGCLFDKPSDVYV